MSLADLPDILISHLCSYLDYTDISNLMETSKKNYNAIKGYKKDKLEITEIWFRDEKPSNYFYYDKKHRYFLFNAFTDSDNLATSLEKILEKCSSVRDVSFTNCIIDTGIFKIMLKYKSVIKSVDFTKCDVDLCIEQFISFCKTFKGSTFIDSSFKDEIWTDKMLAELIPYSPIERSNNDNELSFVKSSANLITDQTLMALVKGNVFRNRFKINGVYNSISVNGIAHVLKLSKDLKTNGMIHTAEEDESCDLLYYIKSNRFRSFATDLDDFRQLSAKNTLDNHNWDLGISQNDQNTAAQNYFNSETGEFNDEFNITITQSPHFIFYKIVPKHVHMWSGIRFAVAK